jgi:hypothetical protein
MAGCAPLASEEESDYDGGTGARTNANPAICAECRAGTSCLPRAGLRTAPTETAKRSRIMQASVHTSRRRKANLRRHPIVHCVACRVLWCNAAEHARFAVAGSVQEPHGSASHVVTLDGCYFCDAELSLSNRLKGFVALTKSRNRCLDGCASCAHTKIGRVG